MKRLTTVGLVGWAAAALLGGRASAEGPYFHGGVTCIEKEIETFDYVCETICEEIRVKVRKPRCVTVIEKRKIQVATPRVEMLRKNVNITVMKRVHHKVKYNVDMIQYVEQTDYKTVRVDHGHWAPACDSRCYGRCSCRKVWVPCLVERTVPCTRLVPIVVTKPVEKIVSEYKPEVHPSVIEYPDLKIEYKTVEEDVAVTKTEWVEDEVVVQVPRVSVKKVPCKRLVRIPLICGPYGCLDAYSGYPYSEAAPPKGKNGEIVPPPGKETPQKDEPKKDEKKDGKPEKK